MTRLKKKIKIKIKKMLLYGPARAFIFAYIFLLAEN